MIPLSRFSRAREFPNPNLALGKPVEEAAPSNQPNCFGHRPPPPLSQGLDPALKTKSFADPSNTASLHRQTVGVVSSRKKFVE